MIDKWRTRKLCAVVVLLVGMMLIIGQQVLSVAVIPQTDWWEIDPEDQAWVKEQNLLFGVNHRSLGLDTFYVMAEGAVERCHQWGIDVVTNDCMLDPQRQLDQVERFISMGCDVVLLNPQDPAAIGPAIEACNKAGITVITFDNEPTSGKVLVHVTMDNHMTGLKCGEATVRLLKERYGEPKGLVLEIHGDPRHSADGFRHDGFHEAVDKYPGIEVLEKVGYWNPDEAFKITQNIVGAYGSELDLIYCQSDVMIPGVVEALSALGYERPKGDPDHIFTVALDASPQSLMYLREGRLDVDVNGALNYYGPLCVDFAVKFLKDGEIPPSSGELNAPGEIWAPAVFSQTEHGVGPRLRLYSATVPWEVPVDDPRLWGNRIKTE